jgi:tripartite-type tricarboxylate transporter receptor subunit TctC
MKFPRRKFLRLAAGAAALPVMGRFASAQAAYPTRPVRWIVGFAAGGANDIVARLLGQFLSEKLGQQFIIEDKAGAGGSIAMATVLSSPPDGYTIGFAAPNNAINATLYEHLPFDFIRDSEPIGGTMVLTNVLEVHPSVPANTVAEFIDYVKANPGRMSFASSGVGASPHLSGELFKAMTSIKMLHVPYRGGGPALTDVLAGRVPVMFDNLPSSIEHIRAGRLRALGVTANKRSDAVPNVPTIGETVAGYEVNVWNGIVAPKGTPPAIIATLNQGVNAVLADPRLKARFAELGGVPMPTTPAEFDKLIRDETEKWAKVIRDANIKPE